jgi:uncharacterized hydrophobic protein (TIGR00271 family)
LRAIFITMNIIYQILENFSLNNEKEKIDKVIDSITRGVVFKGTNLWILVFAIFIASLGLNVNSTAVIIGAMLVSPLMGPIMGMGLSLGINDLELLKNALRNYIFATVVGLITSTIYFLITPINEAHSEILARTQPNIYDVLIAFFGGLAGIIATSSKHKGNVVTGVAIATALMPPLCTAGFGLATLNWQYFSGAFYLYFINTVFIAFATLITVRFLQFPLKHLADEEADKKSKRIITTIVLLTLIPSIYFGYDTIRNERYNSKALRFIELECNLENDYLLNKNIDPKSESITLIYGGAKIEDKQVELIKKKLVNYELEGTELKIKQGFSSEDKSELVLNKSNEKIFNLENENAILRTRLDTIVIEKSKVVQILNEVNTIFPQISSILIQPSTEYSEKSQAYKTIVYIKSKEKLEVAEKKKLEYWLQIRLKTKALILLIE